MVLDLLDAGQPANQLINQVLSVVLLRLFFSVSLPHPGDVDSVRGFCAR